MKNRTLGRAVPLMAAMAVAGAGFAVRAPFAGAAMEPPTVTVTAVESKLTGVPGSIPGGLTKITLKNTGKRPHDLQLIRVDGTHAFGEIAAVLAAEGGPIPVWMHGAGGIGTTAPGATGQVTLNLDKGNYYAASTQSDEQSKTDDVKAGMTAKFTVTGPKAASMPKTTAIVTAREYGFDVVGLKPGVNTVTFTDAGKQLHHLVAVPLLPGKTLADAKPFLMAENPQGPPPVDFDKTQDLAVIDPGMSEIVDLNLPAGSYVFLCFINDRAGGPPHFTKGMMKQVDVK